jgi:DNA replication protein DnaC
LLSSVPPSSLSAPARRSESAAILAAGIVRMKSRVTIADSEIDDDPAELPTVCLEVSSKSVLRTTAPKAIKPVWTHLEYLNELTIQECQTRTDNRIQRRLRTSELEQNRTWDQIQWNRIPRSIQQKMESLRSGEFLSQANSNLPFSKWESIFKDPMTTAAAIDRLVHHSVILELNVPSFRLEQANKNRAAQSEAVSS